MISNFSLGLFHSEFDMDVEFGTGLRRLRSSNHSKGISKVVMTGIFWMSKQFLSFFYSNKKKTNQTKMTKERNRTNRIFWSSRNSIHNWDLIFYRWKWISELIRLTSKRVPLFHLLNWPFSGNLLQLSEPFFIVVDFVTLLLLIVISFRWPR